MASFQRPEHGSQGNWWEDPQQLLDNSDYHFIREQIQVPEFAHLNAGCSEYGRTICFRFKGELATVPSFAHLLPLHKTGSNGLSFLND